MLNCTKKLLLDECECNNDYVYNNSDKKCYKKPDNCVNVVIQTGVLVCQTCMRNVSYLSGNQCLTGTVLNCA